MAFRPTDIELIREVSQGSNARAFETLLHFAGLWSGFAPRERRRKCPRSDTNGFYSGVPAVG